METDAKTAQLSLIIAKVRPSLAAGVELLLLFDAAGGRAHSRFVESVQRA
jgi:hypothetical protein